MNFDTLKLMKYNYHSMKEDKKEAFRNNNQFFLEVFPFDITMQDELLGVQRLLNFSFFISPLTNF